MIKRQTLDDLAEGLAQALLREVQQANETGTTISALTANAIVRLLIRHARYFVLQLAESYLTAALFRQILQRIEQLAWHPT